MSDNTPSLQDSIAATSAPAESAADVSPSASPASAPRPRSLSETIASVTGGAASPAAEVKPAAATEPSSPQQVAQSLRDRVAARFVLPETLKTDDEVFESMAQMVDSAISIREDDTFKEYVKEREAFAKWKASQTGATPATAQPAEQKPTQLSREATALIQHGLLAKTDGRWSTSNPAFQSFADEANQNEARLNQLKIRMAMDPEEFVRSIASSTKPELPAEFAELKEAIAFLKADREQQSKARVESWVKDHMTELFVGGDVSKGRTAFGDLYAEFEAAAPPTLSDEARHQFVLDRIEKLRKHFPPPTASQPAPAAASVPQRPASFFNSANRVNGTNRISEYSGPAAGQTERLRVPLGRGRKPSLSGLIDQMTKES